MESQCLSLLQLAMQTVCAAVSVVQRTEIKRYITGLVGPKGCGVGGERGPAAAVTPRLCAVVSGSSDRTVAINTLRSRGFTVMSIITEKDQEGDEKDFTVLLKVGPKLFPKLVVGLNLPLQPTAKYTQGELYRVYEAAMASVHRSQAVTVLSCYLQHDLPILNECLKSGETNDIIDYFGLEFGLMSEFVSSYHHKLVPVAAVAFMMKGVLIYQYLVYHTCPVQSSFIFPTLVALWSILSLMFWRQRAMALISAAYSGLMLGMVRGSTSSMTSVRADQLLKLIACIGIIGFFAICYLSVHDFLSDNNYHVLWQYALGAVYGVLPPLCSKGITVLMKRNACPKKPATGDEKDAPKKQPLGSSTAATSGIFALEIINHHGVLFYLHFWRNDYGTVRLLLLCKLLLEQAVDVLSSRRMDRSLREKREGSASKYTIEEIPAESGAASLSMGRRLRAASISEGDPRRFSGIPKENSQVSLANNSPRGGSQTGDHGHGKKENVAKRLLRKITGKKDHSHAGNDEISETTEITDFDAYNSQTDLRSGTGSERSAAEELDAFSKLRAGLDLELDVKAPPVPVSVSAPQVGSAVDSPTPFSLGSKSNQVFCVQDLMYEFLQHLTYDEFHLTGAYSRALVLHGYLVLFAAVSPLSIVLILLQLRHLTKMNLVQASNSLRTNFYATRRAKEVSLPAGMAKDIAKAKKEYNPYPTTKKTASSDQGEEKEKEQEQEKVEESGTQLADNMLAAAAYSIRSDALFCFYVNVINVVAIFTNAIFVFHNGLPSNISVLDSVCDSNVKGDTEVVCNVFMNYVTCTAIVFLLLGVKLMIDTFASDAPNYLSEAYMKSVAEQFTHALKFRLGQFSKRSNVARDLEALGKALYSENIQLQQQLANVKLQKIHAKCEQYGNSIVFVTLTLLPIVGHVFLQLPWYLTLMGTLLVHIFFANKNGRNYQTAALEVISDHNLLNLIQVAMPIWTHRDTEPCGWVNDMLGQCWDQINLYAVKKAKEKIDETLIKICPPMLKRMGIRKMGLGDTPPTIHSIRVFSQDTLKTKMEFEVDVTWISECFMQLEIVNHVGAQLLFEICNFKFSGTVRVQCTPMIADVPPFEYARVTFVKPPVFDFSLKIGDGGGFDFVDPIAKAVQRVRIVFLFLSIYLSVSVSVFCLFLY
jgi:hypothetical protein